MQIEIEMQNRKCVNCSQHFRVMATSKQKLCSAACGYGTAEHGAHLSQWNAKGQRTAPVKVNFTEPTKPSEPGKAYVSKLLGRKSPNQIKKQNERDGAINTEETKGHGMSAEQSGAEQIVSDSLRTRELTTIENVTSISNESAEVATTGTRRELSEEPRSNLEMEALGMMNLSKSSAKRLHKLMRVAVSNRDLEDHHNDLKRVQIENIQAAVQCANSIATLLQGNVNLLRALKK